MNLNVVIGFNFIGQINRLCVYVLVKCIRRNDNAPSTSALVE